MGEREAEGRCSAKPAVDLPAGRQKRLFVKSLPSNGIHGEAAQPQDEPPHRGTAPLCDCSPGDKPVRLSDLKVIRRGLHTRLWPPLSCRSRTAFLLDSLTDFCRAVEAFDEATSKSLRCSVSLRLSPSGAAA